MGYIFRNHSIFQICDNDSYTLYLNVITKCSFLLLLFMFKSNLIQQNHFLKIVLYESKIAR